MHGGGRVVPRARRGRRRRSRLGSRYPAFQSGLEQSARSLSENWAALAGVELGEARGEALAAQAEPHFGLLRQLAAVANPADEPAGVFRLDDRDAGDGG